MTRHIYASATRQIFFNLNNKFLLFQKKKNQEDDKEEFPQLINIKLYMQN